jgi:hypothetical protein
MDWTQIIHTVAAGAVTVLSGLVARWLNVKVSEDQRAKATWAIEQGVAYAAERFRNVNVTGVAKKQVAIEAAESLAPRALKKLDANQKSMVVDATYAKMRASLPDNTTYIARGSMLEHQVEELGGLKPLPKPTAVPKVPPQG